MTDTIFCNVWRTKTPEDREALIAKMKDEAPALAAKVGFISMRVLECAADGRVLVEGRWQSEEAFDAGVADDPAAQESRASLAALGSPEPGLFKEVLRVYPAQPNPTVDQFQMTIEEHRAVVNGQTLHYLKAGSGPALLLVHGYPESSVCWRKVTPQLAKTFTVIAPDTRGVGQSSVADNFSLEDVADDLYGLMKSLGFTTVRLVGHDFGVQIVGAYAAKHRDEVTALVVIESPLSAFGLEDLFANFWHFGFLASPFAEMLISGREREFFKAFAFDAFVFRKEAFSPSDIDRYIENQVRPGRLNAGLAYYRALPASKTFFATTAAPPWTFPVLAIDGDHSMNGATAKSFAQIAPGLQSRVAPACGHFVQEEQSEFVVRTLLDFLPV